MTNQPDQWLTIREAAQSLGLSDLSVRRRIKDGRLAFRLEHGKYYVNLQAAPPVRDEEASTVIAAPSTGGAPQRAPASRRVLQPADTRATVQPAEFGALLPDYLRLAERAGQAELLAERLRELEHRCTQLQDGTVALANRNGWLESKLEEREREIKLLADSRHHKSWWRRLLGQD